jgi:Spy/CpxP family protein refolding chaperone
MQLKVLIAASLAVASFSSSQIAFGQQASPPSSDQAIPSTSVPTTTGGWPSPDEAVARLSTKLNLSDDQKSKITPIIADRQALMRELMSDSSGRRLQKARKAKSIMSDSDKKIEALLTSDQKKTYEQMKEERREQMQSRMQERGNGSPQL